MAQEFYGAFGLGTDERHISPMDAAGVALAAIQELMREKDTQIAERDARIDQLEKRLSVLEQRLDSLAGVISKDDLLAAFLDEQ